MSTRSVLSDCALHPIVAGLTQPRKIMYNSNSNLISTAVSFRTSSLSRLPKNGTLEHREAIVEVTFKSVDGGTVDGDSAYLLTLELSCTPRKPTCCFYLSLFSTCRKVRVMENGRGPTGIVRYACPTDAQLYRYGVPASTQVRTELESTLHTADLASRQPSSFV